MKADSPTRPFRAALAASAALLMAGPASAICAVPTPAIVWSSPADGATGVPTNADLLFITTGFMGNEPAVTLDGNPVLSASAVRGHYELGDLEPLTTHTIALTLPVTPPRRRR